VKRVRGDDVLPWLTFVEPTLPEFDELEREVWEFLDIPRRGDKLKLWSEPDARC